MYMDELFSFDSLSMCCARLLILQGSEPLERAINDNIACNLFLQDCSNIDVVIVALFEHNKHCAVGYCVAFGYGD